MTRYGAKDNTPKLEDVQNSTEFGWIFYPSYSSLCHTWCNTWQPEIRMIRCEKRKLGKQPAKALMAATRRGCVTALMSWSTPGWVEKCDKKYQQLEICHSSISWNVNCHDWHSKDPDNLSAAYFSSQKELWHLAHQRNLPKQNVYCDFTDQRWNAIPQILEKSQKLLTWVVLPLPVSPMRTELWWFWTLEQKTLKPSHPQDGPQPTT